MANIFHGVYLTNHMTWLIFDLVLGYATSCDDFHTFDALDAVSILVQILWIYLGVDVGAAAQCCSARFD